MRKSGLLLDNKTILTSNQGNQIGAAFWYVYLEYIDFALS